MKKKKAVEHIPQTLQESIPYERVFAEGGIIEIKPGVYSKSYPLTEMNFKTASNEKQWQTAEAWSKLVASFAPGTTVEVTIYNKTVDIMKFQEDILLNMKNDGLDAYREEYNVMLLDKLAGAKNNLESVKTLTIAVSADEPLEAYEKFQQIDHTVKEGLAQVTGRETDPMSTLERLELLNSIYNQDSAVPLVQKKRYRNMKWSLFLWKIALPRESQQKM